jgi:hypothetical protein
VPKVPCGLKELKEPNNPNEPCLFTGTGLLFGISTKSTAPRNGYNLFCMKLRVTEQRTAEQENIKPQNIEGWNRYALSFESIKLDSIPSYDIRYSLFYPRTRCSKAEVSFWIKLVASAARSGA